MKIETIKITSSIFIFSLFFGLLPCSVGASTVIKPTIKLKKTKNTSVTLEVVDTGLKKKSVKLKVKIENLDTDKEETRVFEKKLNKSGKVDLKVDNLIKDNEYSLKLAIKESSGDDYSDYSNEVSINSEGTFDYNPELSVGDVGSNSVVLDITSAKLKKKKVKIKVLVENKDTDITEVRTFTKTLSKNGKVEITIDNLTADTDYGFKVLVAKSKDNGFSEYSSEKSITTE